MLKLILFVVALAVGACTSDSLRSGGSGGHGGNAGSSGGTGGAGLGHGGQAGASSGRGGNAGSSVATGGATATGGAGGTSVCPAGETLCSVCGHTQCASDCSTVTCAGGTTGSGGRSSSGGAGGATSSTDGGLDGRVDASMDVGSVDALAAMDASANSCENPLPLRCGDRLEHSTLIQGRADVWNTYACTERWMSGREAIYVVQPSSDCQVSVRFQNATADLDLFLLQDCSFKSCSPSSFEGSISFAVHAGQPRFLVVDGYSGDAGSYTLQVDCTCNQDGGAVDAPATDTAADSGNVTGCDSTAAAKAMSAFGIVTTGNAQMLSVTLPAALATDATWGLKSTVCQQAGYDISGLAGKTVCVLGQDTNQLCQSIPSTAWVVMDDGAVACVYKTVRRGFDTALGVYAANDPICMPSAIAPGATVTCDHRSCTNATGPCCPATMLMSRTALCGPSCSVAVVCDGPEDCSNGDVCCSLESTTGLAGASCVKPSQCAAPSRVICHQQTDCLASQQCGPPDPKPMYVSPFFPQEEVSWLVEYQVCAP